MLDDLFATKLGVVGGQLSNKECDAVPVHHRPGAHLFTLQELECFTYSPLSFHII